MHGYDKIAEAIRRCVPRGAITRNGDRFTFERVATGGELDLYKSVGMAVQTFRGARFMSGSPSSITVSVPSDPVHIRRGHHRYRP